MNKDFKVTPSGLEELKQELEELKSRRGELADAIKTARDQGDLKENGEYHDAKDEQGRVETRIAEIEHIINNASLIKDSNSSEVGLGSTVTVATDSGKELSYTVVGSVEADPLEHKISDESPIGQALLGKKVGDEVSVELPAGVTTYVVKSIS